MIEVRNLKKVYTPKKGVKVNALDDVSIRFPETGLVFILGKSGSGKSTLLNMIGGLDKVDSGEIIIKNKSSKDFSQADFDSYRNTYLGFIFQEYNILNEFTVGANIGLALELQGKKATNEKINEILRTVDLEGYAKRKPMQLSGGQKQRVAIARALVKDPEVILADEPTGALDSKTGIQVFDTLKQLAKTKLVIVVSHDREFAESYGDRVIELKDGKVISDIEKYVAESNKKNESISIVDNKIISITKGYELTPEDVKMINEYLKKENAIISIDEMTNRDLKKFARIDDSGNKECFKDTDESEIVYTKRQKFRLIKSRLPFKDSFKIGSSGLKAKPVRLFIAILLSFAAFALFGLADTINAYNKYTATVDSLIDSEVSNLTFIKQTAAEQENNDYLYYDDTKMSDSDIEMISKKTGVKFKGVYSNTDTRWNSLIESSNYCVSPSNNTLYGPMVKGFVEMSSEDVTDMGFTIKKGRMPQDYTEIAITELVYQSFAHYGYRYDNSTIIDPTASEGAEAAKKKLTIDKFLDNNIIIRIRNAEYKVVGIVDTKFNYDHFKDLEIDLTNPNSASAANAITSYILQQEYDATVGGGFHGQVFVKPGFIDNISNSSGLNVGISFGDNISFDINSGNNVVSDRHDFSYAFKLQELKDNNIKYKMFSSGDKLEKNSVLIDFAKYYESVREYYYILSGYDYSQMQANGAPSWILEKDLSSTVSDEYYDYLLTKVDDAITNGDFAWGSYTWDGSQYVWEPYEDEAYNPTTDYDKKWNLQNYVAYLRDKYGSEDKSIFPIWMRLEEDTSLTSYTQIKKYLINKKLSPIIDQVTEIDYNVIPETYTSYYYNSAYRNSENRTITVAGFFLSPSIPSTKDYYSGDIEACVVDDLMYDDMSVAAGGKYVEALGKMVEKSKLKSIVKWGYDNESKSGTVHTKFRIRSGPTYLLDMVNEVLETMSDIFLYVGIGLAVFAGLLLMNYIATSISYKKREIGILRAVGATSLDVFGIFLNESMIIALINYALSVVTAFAVVMVINNKLRTEYNLTLTFLNFGIRQFIVMFLLSTGVAAISSAIPVFSIARKKPIDTIRSY